MISAAAPQPSDRARAESAAFVRALTGDRPAVPPVWFAGQAGPGAPEAVDLLEGRSPLDAAADPALVAARTVAPVDRHGLDAAQLASHVVVPLRLAGLAIEFVPGRGAVVETPVRTGSDVLQLRPIDPAALEPIRDATRFAVAALGSTPLVGVAAAPGTLATLLVEGGPSEDLLRARTMMYADPHSWAALLNWCADVAGQSLRAQVLAGAAAVQLVDTAVGAFGRNDYFKRVLPHSQRVFSHLRGLDVPIIHTGLGTGEVLDLLARAGADAIGVDWRIPLDTAVGRVDPDVTLLGGLDPALLAAPTRILDAHVRDALDRGRKARAHILDLGGALPVGTDPEVLDRIVGLVRDDGR